MRPFFLLIIIKHILRVNKVDYIACNSKKLPRWLLTNKSTLTFYAVNSTRQKPMFPLLHSLLRVMMNLFIFHVYETGKLDQVEVKQCQIILRSCYMITFVVICEQTRNLSNVKYFSYPSDLWYHKALWYTFNLHVLSFRDRWTSYTKLLFF